MSSISKRRREGSRAKIKFLRRITKTLYYGQLPTLPCLSLPVTEVSCEAWSAWQRGRSVRRLHPDAAAGIARSACVSPCALVLAVLYLERLHARNPDYLATTTPAELFLVSLMVGNKFLQDDGEDDEVICSEWAASGGLELSQLKKLELEFLSAIDWNIFVSDKSFESGLQWLERRVALKQAQLRGFFTYTDLVAAYDAALLAELVRSLTSSCAAVALSYMTSLLTLVTSALVVSQAWLPTLHQLATPSASTSAILDVNPITHDFLPDITLTSYVPNSTAHVLLEDSIEELVVPEKIKCCTDWMKYQETPKKSWYDAVVVYDWKSFEPWWSKTSVLNWLYHSSLINPMQRWLERINEYADLFGRQFLSETPNHIDKCQDYVKYAEQQRCVRRWLNLSKLGALVVSVSDR